MWFLIGFVIGVIGTVWVIRKFRISVWKNSYWRKK